MPRLATALFCLLPLLAQAQVYKCVDPGGHTSYSQTPCPPNGGTTTLIELAPPREQVASAEVPAPTLPAITPDNATERMRSALDWLASSYPFLDIQSPQADLSAIQLFMLLQNQSVAAGSDQADALVSAAQLAASQYLRRPPPPAAALPAPAASEPSGLRVIQIGNDQEPPAGEPPMRDSEPVRYYGDRYWHDYPPPPHPHKPRPRPEEEEPAPRKYPGRALQQGD